MSPAGGGRYANQQIAAAAWTPASLPNLVAWYDSSDPATITASANAVSQWNDKSAFGRNIQGTGTAKPLTATDTLNGLNVLKFDGSNDKLTSATPILSTTVWTIAILVKSLNSGAGQGTIVMMNNGAGGQDGRIYRSAADAINGYDGSVLTSGQSFGTTNAHAVLLTNDGSGNGVIYVDSATATASGALGTNAPDTGGWCVGANGFSGEFANIDLSQIVVMSAVISSGDRSSLMGYLKTTGGIP